MKLTGKVIDIKTKEGIPAVVFKSDQTGKSLGVGGQANIDGDYSIENIKIGDFITASLTGLTPVTKKVVNSSPLNFQLTDAVNTLNTFEVIADKPSNIPQKQNWFEINKKWLLIAGAGISVFAITIIVVSSIRKK